MSRMYYKNLMIMSRAKGIAAKFDFSESYNLILSDQKNNVGKSSLVKNIFWCFGCEPYFDDRWKSLDCEVALDFRIDGKIFCIHRYKNTITLIDDIGVKHKYTTIGGDFSSYLLELLNFDAKLKVRDEKHLITPPPAFYFLPFYIDQKKGWSNL
ncbi:hypothetical protein F8A90_09730 [Cobetia sp. cqz5-12]|uniref:hypothetical protein n=1 Tax=Cobetia sp. cqz5-12 TaxID=2609415 RepID=UPI001902F7EC|nr:hypothetical protein [Cobetia sp. cqz5-12]QQK64373.1 hypothetical protein F8A90_09730 [Cobetia sp. cqz5-12]